MAKKEQGQKEIWTKLVERANEDKIFINGQPVTALLDTRSQVTHVRTIAWLMVSNLIPSIN